MEKSPTMSVFGRALRGAMVGWFKSRNWRVEGQLPPDRKFVLVGAPHTSNWDFLVFVGTVAEFGLQVRFIGKHTLFRWPFGGLMRGIGGVPVDRNHSRDLVQQMADQFAAHDDFILIVAPEGTRGPTDRWRTGFYRIALAAGVPLVCAGPDYQRRRGIIGPTIRPTGDYDRDMAPAFAFFRTLVPLHPERAFIP
ncbi:MAG: lysophospholipid acyltransferase family protein [Sphingomicrobium sp.]